VIDDLKAKHDMANATDVMLAGDSAGGMGVWLNLRFVKQQFSASTTVVGAPIAVSAATSFCTGQVAATYFETHLVPQGFYFFVDPYRGPGATKSFLADFSKEAWPAHIELWGSEMDAACREANQNDLAVCMVANTSHPYMPAPVFITESLTDKVVLLYHDSMPNLDVWDSSTLSYMSQWQHNMTAGLKSAATQPSFPAGVFTASCFIHTGFTYNTPLIGGVSYYQTAAKWYALVKSDTSFTPPFVADTCGVLCNPTCAHH
jgi:hypothetical protein